LSNKLITREIFVKTIIGSKVFDIGIVSVASEEVEVLTVRLLLNDQRGRG
jgi:hypothetical protein